MVASRLLHLFLSFACAPPDTGARDEASLALEAQDSVATAVIAPDGGTVELSGVAAVKFPAGAFTSSQPVSVYVTTYAEVRQHLQITRAMFSLDSVFPYEIRINSGKEQTATDFDVIVHVPDDFMKMLGANGELHVFGRIRQESDHEVLDSFEGGFASTFDRAGQAVFVKLPSWAFTDKRRPDRSYEAVIVLAASFR